MKNSEQNPAGNDEIRRTKIWQKILLLLLPLIASTLAVRFSENPYGRKIEEDFDLEKLSPPERKVAQRLLCFPIELYFETHQIELQGKNSMVRAAKGKRKKCLTCPDFSFVLGDARYYLEIGSVRIDHHKLSQRRVVRQAVSEITSQKKIVYVQLFAPDIREFEATVWNVDDLAKYLQNHPNAITNVR